MNPVITLDPQGDAPDELWMDDSATSAWIRIGDTGVVVRLYRARARAERETGQAHPGSAELGIEVYDSPTSLEDHNAANIFIYRPVIALE